MNLHNNTKNYIIMQIYIYVNMLINLTNRFVVINEIYN